MRGAVTVHMKAAPEKVWGLVSDVTRIGEFSPETFEAEWTDGATGPEVGAQFRGHVKRNGVGPVYWTNCKVITCEPGSDFGFAVYAAGQRANTWRYQLRERDGGTDVTESYELGTHPALRLYGLVLGPLRGRTNLRGMRQTLERIKAVVEVGS
ncbi:MULTISPECIES: SRPBCC family protein [unclassified Nocardioides]|uniref:SRPBCC family protein n=1 Tax=unclassified Nocardioides TaxID=2615069 RepID=UPI0006F904F5|nr:MULTISPECIES: SRPBCC family protein [unclassified Nocardioides]KQY64507.1 cyclase [Nocardioides sp. Root140]KRF18292.1 cyclase [Nocardioides sp. Soil796]